MKSKVFKLLCILLSVAVILTIGLAGCKTTTAETTAAETTAAATTAAATTAAETTAAVTTAAAPKEPIKVIWCADVYPDAVPSMFKRFTDATGYEVEIEVLPGGNDYNTLVPARFVSGEVPDLMFFWGSPNEQAILNPAENLLDLSDYYAKNISGKLISEDLVKSMQYQGKNYGLAVWGITVRGFFYNKDVMAAAGVGIPKNWDDFYTNVAPKVKAAGFIPQYGMGLDKWGLDFNMENYVADAFATTDIQDKINNGEANLLDTGFQESMEMIKKCLDAGFFQKDVMTGTYDGAVAAISDGTTFMTGLSTPVAARIPEEAKDKVGGFCLSKDGNRSYIALPHGVFVPKAAKNMDGVNAFMDWFITSEQLNTFYAELMFISPYSGVTNELSLPNAEFKTYVDAQAPMSIKLKASYGQASNFGTLVLSGEKTPEQAAIEMNNAYIESAKALKLPVKE
jgi:raffinose/stachyose/melibiose transport system substrate-binding protein